MTADVRLQRMLTVSAERLSFVEVALEAVHQRHNVSAILRTCDALGVQNAHLVTGHFKPATGPARGAERWLDLHVHSSPAAAIAALRERGLAVWICDLSTDAATPATVPVDRPLCLWFGSEHVGVSDGVRAVADGCVALPMRGFAQSLNVSVAAALIVGRVVERVREIHGPRALLDEPARQALLARWREREDALANGVAGRLEEDIDL